MADLTWIAGVDGCPAGWIVALAPMQDIASPRIRVVRRFAELLEAPEAPMIVAVDMPIGLPERIGGPGRAPEQLVRPLLGARQSSVFSIPARAAIYAADYASACAEAAARSEPPRKVSKQGFMLFPRIREIDMLLLESAPTRAMLFESHPEVVFWALNEGKSLSEPKKIRGRPWHAGMALRAGLLQAHGVGAAALAGDAPRGAGRDDMLDALACLVTARAIAHGRAQSWPAPPARDARNIPIAIWAPLPQSSRVACQGQIP
jgi:predicted RNase H-like nuclease